MPVAFAIATYRARSVDAAAAAGAAKAKRPWFIAGFLAVAALVTFVPALRGALINSAAIRLVQATGIDPGAGGLSKWLLAHVRGVGIAAPATFGPVAQELFHTSVGLVTGIAYVLVRARVPGRPLVRGLLFVQPMWLVQALVILPWLGAGTFGMHRGAATVLASFLLNALFGVVLGLADATVLRSHP